MSSIIAVKRDFLLAQKYLTERGVTPQDVIRAKIEYLPAMEAADRLGLSPKDVVRSFHEAILFPGWMADAEINPDFSNAVFLSRGFGQVPPMRLRRSTGKSQHPNDCIFMPIDRCYEELQRNEVVVLCESFVKAMIVCFKLNLPAVALNGMWGFSHGNLQLVSGLKLPFWENLGISITTLMDSPNRNKQKSKEDIIRAQTLVCALMRGYHPSLGQTKIAALPLPDDELVENWGCDDFHVKHGAAKLREIVLGAKAVSGDPLTAAFNEYNARYIWVRQLDRFAFLDAPGIFYTKDHFMRNEVTVKVRVAVKDMRNNEEIMRIDNIAVAKEYWSYEDRPIAEKVRFLPGREAFVDGDLNLWRGFAVEPSRDPAAILRAEDMFANVIREAMPEEPHMAEHILNHIAHLYQRPETAVSMYFYLYGSNGVGKGYVTFLIRQTLGMDQGHAPSMRVEHYANKFNSLKRAARVVVVPELPAYMEKRDSTVFESELKLDSDANEKTRPIEPKGRDVSFIDRCTLVFLLSNFAPPYVLTWGDRRAVVAHFGDHMGQFDADSRPHGKKDTKWWGERWHWAETIGPEDVLAWALARDLRGFDSAKPPPDSRMKKAFMTTSEKGWEGWIAALHRHPDSVLSDLGVPEEYGYFTSKQLAELHLYARGEAGVPSTSMVNSFGQTLEARNFRSDQCKFNLGGWVGDLRGDEVVVREHAGKGRSANWNVWHIRGEEIASKANRGRMAEKFGVWFDSFKSAASKY